MQAVTTAEALSQQGLRGDRYSSDLGHWQSLEGCQATLISAQELRSARKKSSAAVIESLDSGGHRRNLVIDGLQSKQLEGKTFRIGTAIFRYHKPRPPCGYIDQVAVGGIGKALSHCSGICIHVVSSGRINVGDAVEILDSA